MKKKSLFLLASVAMGAALVGGTFASWAVTDNADPFSIKVSTGNVTTDGTDYVTLEWGSQQSMSHVSNLAANTVRKAGVLDLRANTTSTNAPDGTLSYQLSGGSHLLAKLQVNIYEGNLAATEGVILPATLEGETALTFTNGSKVIQVDKNDANLFTVAVSLATVTPAEYSAMEGEQVSIRFDWGPGTDVADEDDVVTLYATGFSGAPKAYAWTGETQNAQFPGVDMQQVVEGSQYYSVQIPVGLQNVIFSCGDQKSDDIVIATSFGSSYNCYNYSAENHFSLFDPESEKVQETAYYVIGDFTTPETWKAYEANKMSAVSGKTDEFQKTGIVLQAGAKLKVFEAKDNLYFSSASTWDDCGFTLDQDGNIVVTAAGTYTIHIDLSPLGQDNFVDITKTA